MGLNSNNSIFSHSVLIRKLKKKCSDIEKATQENKQLSYDILVSHIIVVDPVTPQFIPRQIGLIKNRSEGVKSGFPIWRNKSDFFSLIFINHTT